MTCSRVAASYGPDGTGGAGLLPKRAQEHKGSAEAVEAEKARLRRIGVIDVGSNSVRLVIFDGMARSPAYFYNEKILCGLGAGLGETGRLNPEGVARALAALHRFSALAARMELSGLIAVATAAVREARDGPAFCDRVEREIGLQLQVISGREEARLSSKGVLLGWPAAEGLVCDMGGSSMELADLSGGEIRDTATSALGPLKLADLDDPEERARYIRKQVKALWKAVDSSASRLFLVGGSWRAIARLDMERRAYPLKVLHGYEPPIPDLVTTLGWIREQDLGALSAQTGISAGRLSLVPLATEVLAELLRRIGPERVTISGYGLREGLLYRQMPERVRMLDPLIEACRHLEATSARQPGFGDALFAWLAPLYGDRSPAEQRLVRAACLLHDVNWRAHPDYRAELCFESVTRSNIGGINHGERVYLGLALLNRYKALAPQEIVNRFGALIPAEQVTEAAILGRAIRLGAMLSGSALGVLDHTSLVLSDEGIELRLRGPGHDFSGESVERRLQSLAARLGRTSALIREP